MTCRMRCLASVTMIPNSEGDSGDAEILLELRRFEISDTMAR